MELPIDTSALTFMCALSPRPVVDEETDQPVVDEQGRPLYLVSLVVLGPAGAQVFSVRVGGEPDPEVRQDGRHDRGHERPARAGGRDMNAVRRGSHPKGCLPSTRG